MTTRPTTASTTRITARWPTSASDRSRRRGRRHPPAPTRPQVVFDVDDLSVLLRRLPRRARRDDRDPPARDHRVHRPVGLRQDHGAALLQPDERLHRDGARSRARSSTTASISTTRRSTPPRSGGASAWCSRSRTRSRRASTTTSPTGRGSPGVKKQAELDDVVERSLRGAALWDEVKDRLKALGPRPVGRPAAAAVHRPGHRRRARGDPDGRAVLGARPDRHRPHRGADAGDQDEVHDRHRHPQHAAGGAGQRPHRVLHHRDQPGERPPHRSAGRVQPDRARSSPTPTTSAPSSTSPGGSADATMHRARSSQEPDAHGDLRSEFHHELDEIRDEIAQLVGRRHREHPRATEILLSQDLEGAEYMILADDEIDARRSSSRSAATGARPAVAGRQRPAPGRRRAADHRRDRALGRPGRQHLQGGTADLRPPARPRAARDHPEDGRPGAAAVPGGDRVLHDERRRRAAALDDMDSYLDGLQRQFVQAIFESHSGGSIDLQVAVQLAVVARFYERIGDHAVNIGERVRFVVTGWMPEHDGRRPLRHPGRRERPGVTIAVSAVAVAVIGAVAVGCAIVGAARRGACARPAPVAAAAPPPARRSRRRDRAGAVDAAQPRWTASSTGSPLGVVVADATGRIHVPQPGGAAAGRHAHRRCSSTTPSSGCVGAGAGRRASRAQTLELYGPPRSPSSSRRRRSTAAARSPRSRTSASAGASTPCAPTSSPTSATS